MQGERAGVKIIKPYENTVPSLCKDVSTFILNNEAKSLVNTNKQPGKCKREVAHYYTDKRYKGQC